MDNFPLLIIILILCFYGGDILKLVGIFLIAIYLYRNEKFSGCSEKLPVCEHAIGNTSIDPKKIDDRLYIDEVYRMPDGLDYKLEQKEKHTMSQKKMIDDRLREPRINLTRQLFADEMDYDEDIDWWNV